MNRTVMKRKQAAIVNEKLEEARQYAHEKKNKRGAKNTGSLTV